MAHRATGGKPKETQMHAGAIFAARNPRYACLRAGWRRAFDKERTKGRAT
jgi:hypothetical protein